MKLRKKAPLAKRRRFVFEKKLVKANIPPLQQQPMVQIKIEPGSFKSIPLNFGITGAQLPTISVPKPKKKVKMWSCAQCNIYFPIPRMLELHNKATHQQAKAPPNKACLGYYKDDKGVLHCQYCTFTSRIRSSVRSHALRRHGTLIKAEKAKTARDEDDEIERTIVIQNDEDDENSWEVETLDENLPVLAKLKEKKAKDPLQPVVVRKCSFCPYICDNSSTIRSHVKRKHHDEWLKMRDRDPTEEESPQPKRPKPKPKPRDALARPTGTRFAKVRKCPHCPFETMTKSTLYSHIKRTHRSGKEPQTRKRGSVRRNRGDVFARTGYACSYCTFAAATMSSLKCHTAREHGEQKQPVIEFPVDEFDCDQCDFKIKSRKGMQLHVKTEHRMVANEDGLFGCHLCSYESTSAMGVQRHISVKHDRQRREDRAKAGLESKVFTCENCDYYTLNAKILEWHKRRHDAKASEDDDGNAYYCHDCDFSTWTKRQILTHIKRNHPEDVGQQKTRTAIAEESMTVEPKNEHPYSCNLCNYTSKNKHVMKVHMIRKHTEGFNHACELCGKQYKVKADLTNHMRFQHREQPIICDVCGKTCRNSNLLYLHQKFAHYKPEFECHICHRRMVSQANLDEHVLKQHEQRQDAICEECGKTFTRQSRLKIHMRTHLGLRPYTCHICGKTFARKNGMRQHLLIHTGQRPYICDICGKDFTQKTGLISHRKSHPGSHPPLPRVYIDHVLSTLNEEKT